MTGEQLRALTADKLELRVEELRREQFHLRLRVANTHIKSFPSDQRKLKYEIARTLTILSQKQKSAEGLQ